MATKTKTANVGAPEAKTYALAACLTVLAGFVDATGYIHFNHLFVSFMSGNSTQAAVAAAAGDGRELAVLGRTLLLFVAGVIGGELIASWSRRWSRPLVLLVEASLLGTALATLQSGSGDIYPASAMALAMGVQNAAVHKAEGISVALTYVTGTLVHVGRGLAAALRGTASPRAVVPFLGLWVGLASGGSLGALVATSSLTLALAVAIATSVVLLLWTATDAARAPDGDD